MVWDIYASVVDVNNHGLFNIVYCFESYSHKHDPI